MNITYVNEISAHEVNCLRSSIGFRKINLEQLNASLAGSAYGVPMHICLTNQIELTDNMSK